MIITWIVYIIELYNFRGAHLGAHLPSALQGPETGRDPYGAINTYTYR